MLKKKSAGNYLDILIRGADTVRVSRYDKRIKSIHQRQEFTGTAYWYSNAAMQDSNAAPFAAQSKTKRIYMRQLSNFID